MKRALYILPALAFVVLAAFLFRSLNEPAAGRSVHPR